MNNNPADARAEARAHLGLSRETEQTRSVLRHPSVGGTRGYPVHQRRYELDRVARGLELAVASRTSCWRWSQRLLPYRMTGNKARSIIVGYAQFLLAVAIIIHPDSSLLNLAAFIYNNKGGLFSTKVVSHRLEDLHVTRKKASTEAYQAFTPENILCVHHFFNRPPPPLGIVGIKRRPLINIDKFGITIERTNTKVGWAVTAYQVRKPGLYGRGSKLTVLFAVEPGDPNLPDNFDGSVQRPHRWIRVIRDAGTTVAHFACFVDYILSDIEQNGNNETDDFQVLLWDNLNLHLSAFLSEMVESCPGPRRFFSVARPPYQPKYGPIEYKICDLIELV